VPKRWSNEEILFLEEKWGVISVQAIAKRLNRTENAILGKKQKLKLGRFLECGEYVTLNQLLHTLGYTGGQDYKKISWVKNRGLPVKKRKVINCSFQVIEIKDFWKWAERNKDILNFTNFEENALGIEPEWVKKHRKRCFYDYKKNKWTAYEDSKLIYMLKEFKYTYEDISKELNRSSGAIQRRITDLKLKERPVKADNTVKWTENQTEQLKTLLLKGYGYKDLALEIGKSDKAVRGKVYMMFKTENLDKARQIIEDMEVQKSG
jgi:hypothetical protein